GRHQAGPRLYPTTEGTALARLDDERIHVAPIGIADDGDGEVELFAVHAAGAVPLVVEIDLGAAPVRGRYVPRADSVTIAEEVDLDRLARALRDFDALGVDDTPHTQLVFGAVPRHVVREHRRSVEVDGLALWHARIAAFLRGEVGP